ncbi:type VI secretion system baseplate subunit TssE [Nitrogeniibacter mangrovi]|uniref:Type VI secretion system baseplate subunit TssE n=1 Tax=Nitrogeniibacter mangrovi TaxID=2016596 RepID=A0A6C1B255_9RHOO|nr:type VI secretion system baseplate subunit TssE [Nitrogeniibacter mangrovi]QID17453.1 type VI secretion system baseplate subunit TssE [Nitrogeniibacter mangrovi]
MKGFEPSLLDKLFGDDVPAPARRQLSLDEIKDSVARDLEALLNTRTTLDEALAARYPEAMRSLVSFGLNDFAGLSLASVHDRARICRAIELAIARHEPRLQAVQVRLELNRNAINALFFSIKAMLVIRPAQEPVSFDAMLQPTTLQYSVNRHAVRATGA